MTPEQYEATEVAVVQLIAKHMPRPLALDEVAKEVFKFALLLAKSAYQKLDDALRDPEEK